MERAARVIAKLRQSSVSADELVRAAWPAAVGKRLGERTRASNFYRSTLVVEVDDEVWRSNLNLLRPQILDNLARVLGPSVVESIEFRVRIRLPRFGPQVEQQSCSRAIAAAVPSGDDDDDADGITDPVFRLLYKNARKKAASA